MNASELPSPLSPLLRGEGRGYDVAPESDSEDDEPSLGHRRRKLEVGDLDITPMIDVTFLLLIFFMVTSTMKEPATADVPPARYGVGTDSGEATILTVMRPDDSGEVQVRFPDATLHALADLRKTEELTNLVRTAATADPPRLNVVINADRDLPHGTVREISQMAGKVEGIRLFLGVQDK
ncbi:MAG: biopolymer transporter ExbD [Planctomycetota bacterium]|nr:biopolymer transporter ExbD [Planctomycetaceae bacterium]MDQ3333011.1 biopolymer transporter ExbD [Planctomycetota bacterium]